VAINEQHPRGRAARSHSAKAPEQDRAVPTEDERECAPLEAIGDGSPNAFDHLNQGGEADDMRVGVPDGSGLRQVHVAVVPDRKSDPSQRVDESRVTQRGRSASDAVVRSVGVEGDADDLDSFDRRMHHRSLYASSCDEGATGSGRRRGSSRVTHAEAIAPF